MDIRERLTAYLARPVDGFRSIATGWETEVYAFDLDGAPRVLRLYQGRNVAVRAETEYRMMRQLGLMGYPVPQVNRFESDSSVLGGPFVLMERVEGRPMADLFRTRPPAALVEELCRLMVRLHRLDWRTFVGEDGVWPDLPAARGSYDLPWVLRLLSEVDLLEPFQPLIHWLEESGREVDFRLAPLHGDFHFENVLVRVGGEPVVIDWGITGIGDPRCDLAYSYILMTTQGSPELGELIRQGYEMLAGPQFHFDYFVAWALIRRLLVTMIVALRGSAALGLRPGLEAVMRERIGYVRSLMGLVADRTGLDLSGMEALLNEQADHRR